MSPPFHSIVGNAGRWNVPLKESSDGVVPYWSSHLDGALSEKIVHAINTTAFQNPEAITEMKRILISTLKRALSNRSLSSIVKTAANEVFGIRT